MFLKFVTPIILFGRVWFFWKFRFKVVPSFIWFEETVSILDIFLKESSYLLHYKTRNMAPTIYCIKYIFLPSPPSKSVSSLTTIVLDISIVYFVWKIRVKMMQEPISSIITKVEMAKDIHLQMWFFLDIWCGKLFAIWKGQIPLKPIYALVTYEPASS